MTSSKKQYDECILIKKTLKNLYKLINETKSMISKNTDEINRAEQKILENSNPRIKLSWQKIATKYTKIRYKNSKLFRKMVRDKECLLRDLRKTEEKLKKIRAKEVGNH